MSEDLSSSSKRGIKLLGKKKETSSGDLSGDGAVTSESPGTRNAGRRIGKKRDVSADLPTASVSPQTKGGKGIESIQKLVSKNKRRFVDKQHGFNLDLSYIGDRIIAMGFPSEGKEAAYRNPMSEVFRFLETFHAGHYKVYNLCSERSYDPSCFNGRVARYPFDDHNCPPLSLIYECCRDIDAWMKDDPKNIAAIHCKAGKGRTGLIIGCWLQYNNEWSDADKALSFYAAARTHNQKGVTIPSQLRYVHYFGGALRLKGGYSGPPPPKTLLLREILLRDFVSPGELRFTVQALSMSGQTATLRQWKDAGQPLTAVSSKRECADVSFCLHPPLPLSGDVRIAVAGKPVFFHFWLSTCMMTGTSCTLQKKELDKANKDKKKVFPTTFHVELVYAEETKSANTGVFAIGKENVRRKHEYRYPTLINI